MLGYLLINYLGVNDPSNSYQSCFFTLEKRKLSYRSHGKRKKSENVTICSFTVSLFWKIETHLK